MRKLKRFLYGVRVYAGILVSLLCCIAIIAYMLIQGIPHISLEFLFGEGESLLPMFITTILTVLLTLILSVPVGVGCAIYINEYQRPDALLVKIIRIATECLSGIPSILYGLFGFLFFVIQIKWSWSILAGVFTLAIMVLPNIIRGTEEALKSVPDMYREGCYALGAGKLRTILVIVLPNAISGILASVLLSIGRIVGETAALILTAGTVVQIPASLMDSGSTLSVYMYTVISHGLGFGEAYATGVVLLVTVLLLNIAAKVLCKKLSKGGA